MSDTEPNTALELIRTMTPALAFAPGAVEQLLGKVRAAARAKAAMLDVSRPADRAAIASLRLKIAKTKTGWDAMGKDLVEDWKKQAKVIDVERKRVRDELDALADEIEAPLVAFKQAEQDRIDGHEAALLAIQEAPGFYDNPTNSAADLQRRLDHLLSYPPRDWQEFAPRAQVLLTNEIALAEGAVKRAVRREAEAAELARLRAEQAERERQEAIRQQAEREARIAREAAEKATRRAEAERDRLAAEAKMQAEREAARVLREVEERAAVERQKAAAEAAAQEAKLRKAEEDRLAAERQAETDRAAAAEREARLAREAAAREAQAQARAEQAERDAQAKADAAVAAEQQRQHAAAIAEAAATKAREADKAHRGKINREAMEDFAKAGLDDKMARAAVTAIAKGEVRHVRLSY